ncbi:hypothetical protein WIMU106979_24000 [Williamsia muralis]
MWGYDNPITPSSIASVRFAPRGSCRAGSCPNLGVSFSYVQHACGLTNGDNQREPVDHLLLRLLEHLLHPRGEFISNRQAMTPKVSYRAAKLGE